MTQLSTGYFAAVGRRPSRVHVVKDGQPICGSKPKSPYQWCAHGIHAEYVTCPTCGALIQPVTDAESVLYKRVLGGSR